MRRLLVGVAFGVVLVLLWGPAAVGEAARATADTYEVIDLGLGRALAVNEHGEVVGVLDGHAFVWQPTGTLADLHVAADWPVEGWSSAFGITRHGEIVAALNIPGGQGPSSWTYFVGWNRGTGVVDDISFITNELSPGDVNNRGEVVGGEMGAAYLWSLKDGAMALVDDGVANAVRINDHGQILGATSGFLSPPGWPDGLYYVIRERDGSLTQVAFFEMGPPPNPMPAIGGINNRGQVVYTHRPDTSTTVIGRLWDPKAGLAEYEGFAFEAINDHGLIAGWTRSNDMIIPIVMDENGIAVQLPAPDGWSGGGSVLDVNNHGVAAGWLLGPDGQHAAVWTPVK